MDQLAIGQPYPSPTPLREGIRCIVTASGLQVVMAMAGVTNAEIVAVERERLSVGYLVTGPVVWHLFGFSNLSWMDTTWSGVTSTPRLVLDPQVTTVAVTIVLVDATSQLIRGMRTLLIDAPWAAAYQTAIGQHLAGEAASVAEYERVRSQIMDAHATSDLVKEALRLGQVHVHDRTA